MKGKDMSISFNSQSSFNITQAGHNFLIKGMNSHDCLPDYCFVYVSRGTQSVHIPGKGDVEAPAGSFVIYPPGEQSRTYISDNAGENYWITFRNFKHEILNILNFEPYKIYHTIPTNNVDEHLEKIVDESFFRLDYSSISLETLFIQLLIMLWRKCNNININIEDAPPKSKDHSIAMAVYMMKSQCQKNYTLDEYAKMCNLSSYTFSHKFKEEMGMPPMIYRKLCRLKKTRMLMRAYPSWSIAKIAEMVGFESTSYFCSAFKEYFNITPSEYRKLPKNNYKI